MVTRRQFIKTGLAGIAVLVTVRAVYGPFSDDAKPLIDDYHFVFLSEEQRVALGAIASVALAGALPSDASAYQKALKDVLRGLDVAISGFLPGVQKEVRQLLDLLTFPPTRRLVAGVRSSWADAKHEDIEGFLNRWANSRFDLLQVAYQALRQLIVAAWYGNADSWNRIGYAGPPNLP
ncbi:MAG TPA: hypothetical protein VM532_07710 [Burkholderiales bacterium]|nr:hypothetical protein [Burkholderiales bacterium]